MPAIQLARLKIQTGELVTQFDNPSSFVRRLHYLMDYYADRTLKPGKAGEPPPLITAFNVPRPVLRQVKNDLVPYVSMDKESALVLCDTLWEEPFLEFRLLAINLLGLIPFEHPDEVLDRINAWAVPGTEDRLLDVLVNEGLAQVRNDTPERYITQLEEWLTAEDDFLRRIGLKAVSIMVSDRDFQNLPRLFRLLAPLVRSSPSQLRPDLLDVMRALAIRSPNEAAFFLRQNLTVIVDDDSPAWLIRNSVRYFPEEVRSSLKTALREKT